MIYLKVLLVPENVFLLIFDHLVFDQITSFFSSLFDNAFCGIGIGGIDGVSS